MPATVTKLNDAVAACPSCGEDNWYILIDGFGGNWNNILGTECCECGFSIKFKMKVLDTVKKEAANV